MELHSIKWTNTNSWPTNRPKNPTVNLLMLAKVTNCNIILKIPSLLWSAISLVFLLYTTTIHCHCVSVCLSVHPSARLLTVTSRCWAGFGDGSFLLPILLLFERPNIFWQCAKLKCLSSLWHFDCQCIQEIFGPVLTIYVYKDSEYKTALSLVDNTTEFALTGSIFATDQ